MKKQILFLTLLLIVSIFPSFKMDVLAVGSCGSAEFALSNINQDKSQTYLGCYSNLSAAKSAMTNYSSSYNDMIVQHEQSLSPLKIVAAQRAIAAAYPLRRSDNLIDNSVLLTVWQYVSGTSFSGFNTYMQAYRDLFYYTTDSFDTSSGDGSAYVEINGFKGYVHIKSIDIIPLIYIEKGWSITLGGNTYEQRIKGSTTEEQPFTLVPHINKYNVYTNNNYTDVNGTTNIREISHSTVSTYSGDYFSDYTYGKAPDWLANGTYYSPDSIHFYYDMGLTKPVYDGANIGEYYNYYQYLPLRSKSNLEVSDFNNYLTALGYTSVPTSYTSLTSNQSMLVNQGSSFKLAETNNGINALLVFALAMHESGAGRSKIAIEYNNLYGWGAYDTSVSSAKIFSDIASSINEYTGMHIRGYLSIENSRFFSSAFATKNSGIATKYASDPYWANKISGWAYRIDRYSGFKDYNTYKIGLIPDTATYTVKDTPSDSSLSLYSTTNVVATNKIRNYSFVINDQFLDSSNNNWYEVFSTQPITDAGVAILYSNTSTTTDPNNIITYNWQNGRGYIKYPSFKIIADGEGYQYIPFTYSEYLANKAPVFTASLIKNEDNTFNLSGNLWQEGVSTFSSSMVTYKLNLIDQTGTTQKSITLNSVNTPDITSASGNGLFTYNYSGYSLNNINFSSLGLADGVYKLNVSASVANKNTPMTYNSNLNIIDFSQVFNTSSGSTITVYRVKNIAGYGVVLEVDSKDSQSTFDNFLYFNNKTSPQTLALTTGKTFVYTSSDPNVVSVANDTTNTTYGIVTPMGVGNAVINVNIDSVDVGQIFVVVDIPMTDFTLTNSTLNFTALNQQQTISASLTPTDTNHTALKYYSLNSSVVTVDASGVVTAHDNGYTKVVVMSADGKIVKTVNVTVAITATSISLNTSSINISNIKDGNLYATLDANNALTQNITWSSSNSNVAKVTNGLVEAVSRGTATITATLNSGATASATINSMILGDANGDNLINLLDIITLRKYMVGSVIIDETNLNTLDINGDSNVNLVDLIRLRRILIGLE